MEHTWLFSWLARLRSEHPGIEIALRVDTTEALGDGISRGDFDLAAAAQPLGDRDVQKLQLPSLPMAFVGSTARHRKATYRFEEIARDGIITFQGGSQPHRSIMKLLRSERIDDCRVDLFSSIASMVRAVQRGFGAATLPATLGAESPEGPLRLLPCDVTLPSLPVWLSWPVPAGPQGQAVVDSALAFVKSRLRDHVD